MAIGVVVSRGYGSFGSIADVVRAGYVAGEALPEAPVQTVVQVAGDGDLSWKEYVEAEFRRKHLQEALVQEEKKLAKVEKRIKEVEKKVAASEHPEGVLANLQSLAFKRQAIEHKISRLEIEMVPLELFLEAEIDDDDEEVMLLS